MNKSNYYNEFQYKMHSPFSPNNSYNLQMITNLIRLN